MGAGLHEKLIVKKHNQSIISPKLSALLRLFQPLLCLSQVAAAKPAYVIQNALPLSPQRVGMVKKMYHTQEKRASKLTAPIICSRRDAWLGEGYYFWWYPIDAILWGENSKKATGYYEVYSAEILLDNVLNTSFNIEHYEAWNEIIASIARDIATKTGHTATIQQVNDYVRKRAGWQTMAGVEGILMDDTVRFPK